MESKVNDTCIVCGEKFEPRLNKKYCSEKCRHKHYYWNKKEALYPDPEESGQDKPGSMKIYYNEYKKVKDTIKRFLPIELYCFLRKDLSNSSSIDFIVDYINNFDLYFFDEELLNDPKYKQYQLFLRDFFQSGKIEIIESRDKEDTDH